MKTVLVTGGFGRVGRHVVRRLLSDGYRVKILSRSDRSAQLGFSVRAETVVGNLTNFRDVQQAVAGADIVCHLAAVFPPYFFEENEIFDTNVKGTFHVLQAMRQSDTAKKIVFASTDAVYATGLSLDEYDRPLREDMPLWPTNVYGICKCITERMIEKYARLHGFSYLTLRLFWVMDAAEMIGLLFRARNYLDNVVPADANGLDGEDIVAPLLESGEKFYEHVVESRDAALGVSLAVENDTVANQTFNIAAPNRLDYSLYYKNVADTLGRQSREVRVRGLKNYEADISKAVKILGYRPEFPIERMITEALSTARPGT